MNFMHKLSRRLALVRAVFGAVFSLALLACEVATPPIVDPTAQPQLAVSPPQAAINYQDTVRLRAVTISAAGDTALAAVKWSANAGTVTDDGLYASGSEPGQDTVTATDQTGQTARAAIGVGFSANASPPWSQKRPAAVRNFLVQGATSSSITLSFTEVDDGFGNPASYEIRLARGTISWGSAADVTQGTCTVPIVGGAVGAARACTVTGLPAATPYQFQMVAFRGSLAAGAVLGRLSSIAVGSTGPVPPVPVALVTVSPGAASLVAGGTLRLGATLTDADGNTLTGRTVTWSSSNAAVATVSSSGLVSAVSAGVATITATSEGTGGTSGISVSLVPVASVSVTPANAALSMGQTTPLAATPRDAAGNALSGRVVTWSSSNPAAAVVTTDGVVTALAAGLATITATVEGQSGASTVAVSVVPVASVTVAPPNVALYVGQTAQLTATPKDSTGKPLVGRPVTWSSSNSAVAVVSTNGLVTAAADGSAAITATVQGQSGTAAIGVSLVPVASVVVTPSTASLQVGQTAQLTATLKDATGNTLSGRAIAWSSSSSTVATINATGLVTGVAAGSATVTATSEGKSGTAQAVVSAPPAGPGAVTDLAATGATDSSVTLAFTEVNNGTGNPASYDVRYAVNPMSWGSASSVARGTCTTPVTGTTIGARRTCTVLGLVSSTSYEFQLVAYRGTLSLDAVFGPLSNVAGQTTTAPTIDPPPGDSEPVDPGSGYLFADNFDRYASVIATLSPGNCASGTDGFGVPNAFATYGNRTRPNTGGAGTCTAPSGYTFVTGRGGSGNAFSNHLVADPSYTQVNNFVWTPNWGSGGVTDNFSYASGRTIVFQIWFKGTGPGIFLGKWFEMWYTSAASTPSGRIQMGIWNTHRNPSWSVNGNGVTDRIAAQPVGPYPEIMTDNQWHRMTIAYKPNSSGYGQNPSSRDGLFRAWIDGTKIIDCSASALNVTPTGGSWPWCVGNNFNGSSYGPSDPSGGVGAGLDWLPAGDSHQIVYVRFPDLANGTTDQFDLAWDDLKIWTVP